MGIQKFVAKLNQMNRGKIKFAVVERYPSTFTIVGAHRGDKVTFNYPSDFSWDGSSFNRTNEGGIKEKYYLLVE